VRKLYPDVDYVGVADGASDNWTFLQPHVREQILDFYHATEYLSKASKAAFKRGFEASAWLDKACDTLKNRDGGAALVLKEIQSLLKKRMKDEKKKVIESSITYFTNHLHPMLALCAAHVDYHKYQQKHWPIGSGVIEAACKVIICNSGMKWTDNGARTVLALRCFNKSDGMWEQFWNKINRHGK